MMRVFALVVCLAMLAGCAGEGPTVQEKRATDPTMDGIVVTARVTSDAGRHRMEATAHNDGSRTYQVKGVCQSPWGTGYRDPQGRPFEAEAPTVSCLGFSWEPFGPGAQRRHSAFWNETRWDAEGGELEPVAPGMYEWSIAFRAAAGRDAPENEVRTRFDVRVP